MNFSFEAKIAEQIMAGKTKGEAVRQAVRQFPDLHHDFIARAQSAGFKFEISAPIHKSFDDLVKQSMAAGKSKGEAICLVAREFPDLHQAYVDRIQIHGVR